MPLWPTLMLRSSASFPMSSERPLAEERGLFQLPRSRCERKKGQKCPGPPSRTLPSIQLEEVGGTTESPWVAAECW